MVAQRVTTLPIPKAMILLQLEYAYRTVNFMPYLLAV